MGFIVEERERELYLTIIGLAIDVLRVVHKGLSEVLQPLYDDLHMRGYYWKRSITMHDG